MTPEGFDTRVRFINTLARRLHEYGTSAPRLEAALEKVSSRLGLSCNSISMPTSIVISYADKEREDLALRTQVLRLEPGEVNLKRLAQVDAIADRVYESRVDLAEGYRSLREIERRPRRLTGKLQPAAYGLASGSVAALFKGSWVDVAAAAAIGTVIGLLVRVAAKRPNVAAGLEAIAALVAGFLACLVHVYATPISVNSVLISGLIVLLPGMMMTTAVNELATQHYVSGVARFAGAATILLKLAFGTAAAMHIANAVGFDLSAPGAASVPPIAELVALAVGSFAFAILFRAGRRDYPLVMMSAWLGYAATKLGGSWFGAEFGVFFAGLVVSSAANAYGRLVNRPGALVRVPGIILLVPGSVGFRSLSSVFERDISAGLETAVSMVVLLVSLVAGLLFGNVVVPPRRSLS